MVVCLKPDLQERADLHNYRLLRVKPIHNLELPIQWFLLICLNLVVNIKDKTHQTKTKPSSKIRKRMTII
jgi:hypothetical protein